MVRYLRSLSDMWTLQTTQGLAEVVTDQNNLSARRPSKLVVRWQINSVRAQSPAGQDNRPCIVAGSSFIQLQSELPLRDSGQHTCVIRHPHPCALHSDMMQCAGCSPSTIQSDIASMCCAGWLASSCRQRSRMARSTWRRLVGSICRPWPCTVKLLPW